MNVALVVITDGRGEYLERCLPTLPALQHSILIDDSGDEEYGKWCDMLDFDQIVHHSRRCGLAASVKTAWSTVSRSTDAEHIFHVEEDFTFPQPPPVDEMADLLNGDPWLAQVVLKRQAWSPEEMAAGGIIELHPDDYLEAAIPPGCTGPGFMLHRRIFSFNPCLYPVSITYGGNPGDLEADVTKRLVADGYHFGMFGARNDPPRCTHIGARRSAAWKS